MGVGGQHHAPGRFTTGKDPVPIVQEAGWAPGPVWTSAENLAPHRDSIPGLSSPLRVAIPTELSRPLILKKDAAYSSETLAHSHQTTHNTVVFISFAGANSRHTARHVTSSNCPALKESNNNTTFHFGKPCVCVCSCNKPETLSKRSRAASRAPCWAWLQLPTSLVNSQSSRFAHCRAEVQLVPYKSTPMTTDDVTQEISFHRNMLKQGKNVKLSLSTPWRHAGGEQRFTSIHSSPPHQF